MMDKKDLLKRKEKVLRLAEEGYQFERYDPDFTGNDIDLRIHYQLCDLILDLKQARLAKNVTQAEIAEKIGTKQTAVSRFESYGATPTLPFLIKYAAALGIDIKVRLEDDFSVELPAELRESTRKICAATGLNLKETLTDSLRKGVEHLNLVDTEILATFQSCREQNDFSYRVDISSLQAQK